MQNKSVLLIFIFLPLFLFISQSNLIGDEQMIVQQDTNSSIFSQKVKSPKLTPVKKEPPTESAPVMEVISETNATPQPTQKSDDQNKKSLEMPLIKTDQALPAEKKRSKKSVPTKSIEPEQIQVSEQKTPPPDIDQSLNKRLSVEVENVTGKTIYVACFSYIKKRALGKWRWDKSPVYKLDDNQKITLYTDKIEDNEDRSNIFGYLGVFENNEEAEDATFELLSDKKKIDLDLVEQLKDKIVRIEIEKYGILGDFYDYDFVKIRDKNIGKIPELDFTVENKTGKPVFATCFVYEKKAKGSWLARKTTESWGTIIESRDDMSVWRYDKTTVIKINPNEIGKIDVDTIIEQRDREYVRGYLVLFDEDEQKLADEATYELLPSSAHKIDIGRLINLKNKNITVYAERYGSSNFIDYTVQSTQRVDLSKITKKIR